MTDFDLNDNVKTKEEVEFDLENRKWNNRRKMAYLALYANILFALLTFLIALVRPEALENLDAVTEIVVTVILGLTGVVGAYFGVTGWYDISALKKKEE